MERLTIRSSDMTHENGVCCTHFNSVECKRVNGNCAYGCKWEEEAWSKLAEYEDAEEQGLLIRLPCKIGDDVYTIPSKVNYDLNVLSGHSENNRVYHQKVYSITLTDGHWYMECDKDHEYGTGRLLLDTSYKETWFLTKAEAEKALAELQSK